MLKLRQHQKLLHKLSPQQIQLMKLLQVPTHQLEERIKEELEENPTLEYNYQEENEEDIFEKQEKEEEDLDRVLQEELEEHLQYEEEEYNSYYTGASNSDDDEGGLQEYLVQTPLDFHDFLMQQIALLDLNDTEYIIATEIIGNIDDDGYLRRDIAAIVDDLQIKQNVFTQKELVEDVLNQIKGLEPPGVGAKDLQETLILQMERFPDQEQDDVKYAIIIIESFFEEYTNKQFKEIQEIMDLTDAQLKASHELILSLNPKPGAAFSSSNANQNHYIIPDFFIVQKDGDLELTLNARNAPELQVSPHYIAMLKAYDKSKEKNKEQREALLFLKQKIDAAQWFIEAIIQRQQTLLLTMHAIMEFQRDYFMTGDEMRLQPMILKDIAEEIDMDISTVSRVANSKYVQTEYGTFPLRFFFSEAIQKESGEEVSSKKVLKIIENIIAAEDKKHPLSDQKIMEELNAQGYKVARRTVAKYRENLKIPIARLRKEI